LAEEVVMTTHKGSRLESLIERDENLRSRYQIVKEKAIEIIKWSSPPDPSVPEAPPYYTGHGVEHSQRILGILDRLTERLDLQICEAFPLLCSVWLHDIGMFVGRELGEPYETTRKLHHLRTVEYVKQEAEAGRLPLDQWQLPNVLDICRAHRSRVKFDDEPIIPKERPFEDGIRTVRVRLLGSLLRFADACDVHHSRAPEAVFEIHKEFIPRVSKEHWKKHFRVSNVRFNWDKACVEIPVILPEDDVEKQNEQRRIARLVRGELEAELRSVERIFEEYGVSLFHVSIIDYRRGEYIDFSHLDERDTLGWIIRPFVKESSTPDLDLLILQPILAQEEVEQCYIEIPVVKELAQEIEKHNFSRNCLFYSHPRTGKTSMLAYLSAKAQEEGFNVFWFSRQSNVPSGREFIRKLSAKTSLDEGTILVFDDIHEDRQIVTLIGDLRRQKPGVTIWCAGRISEFVDLRDEWDTVGKDFIEREAPGYLDHDSIMLFLDRYRELLDEETEGLILHQENVTAYYLVDVYTQLKRNELAEDTLPPKDIVAQVSIDVKEDNRKTFGGLDEIERLALKIISYLGVSPRVLLERLLQRSDPEKGQGVVESLLSRKIVFPEEKLLLTPRRTKVEAICIFDSFEEFVTEQTYELDTRTVIPGLLLAEAHDCQDELPFALLTLMDKCDSLDDQQREQMKGIVLARKESPVALWVASYLAYEDRDFLLSADSARESTVQVAPETLGFFGAAFSKHENHPQAIIFLEKALEMEPDKPLWLHELAHCYEEMENLESAVEHMEKAADKAPRYLDCLGVLYDKSGRDDQALECYQRAIKDNRDNTKAWNNMAWIYWERGDSDKARECCEAALEIDPEFVWSLRGMADIFYRLRDFEKAKEYCLRALSVEEDNEKTWAMLADSCSELGDYDEAIQALERAVELNPEEARYYYGLGCYHGELDELDKAVFYYNQTVEKDPEYVEAYVNRGAAYYNQRADYGTALKDFQTAILIQPSHALAHVCLGNALWKLGETRKAQREYKIALGLDPGKEPHAHSSAQEILQTVKDRIEQIEQDYSSITEQGEELDAKSLNGLAYNMIMAGLFDGAAEVLEIGLEKDPNYSYLYATKGLLYFRQGDIDQGRELYEQAISMSPDDLALRRKFHYEHGMALRIQGRFDEAIEELECALNIASDYVLDEQIEVETWKAERRDDSE
jgi:tetratricopeptide (TPR) repeat protein